MHWEILTEKQNELLPYLKLFRRRFYLVGGTAIALHIGHRRSVDFDLFYKAGLNKKDIRKKLIQLPFKVIKISEDSDQIRSFLIDKAIDLEN